MFKDTRRWRWREEAKLKRLWDRESETRHTSFEKRQHHDHAGPCCIFLVSLGVFRKEQGHQHTGRTHSQHLAPSRRKPALLMANGVTEETPTRSTHSTAFDSSGARAYARAPRPPAYIPAEMQQTSRTATILRYSFQWPQPNTFHYSGLMSRGCNWK